VLAAGSTTRGCVQVGKESQRDARPEGGAPVRVQQSCRTEGAQAELTLQPRGRLEVRRCSRHGDGRVTLGVE